MCYTLYVRILELPFLSNSDVLFQAFRVCDFDTVYRGLTAQPVPISATAPRFPLFYLRGTQHS